jgi:hypothetical protein
MVSYPYWAYTLSDYAQDARAINTTSASNIFSPGQLTPSPCSGLTPENTYCQKPPRVAPGLLEILQVVLPSSA